MYVYTYDTKNTISSSSNVVIGSSVGFSAGGVVPFTPPRGRGASPIEGASLISKLSIISLKCLGGMKGWEGSGSHLDLSE